MKITKTEIGLALVTLNYNSDLKSQRRFPIGQLKLAGDLAAELRKHTSDTGVINEGEEFEVELSTDQKKYLKDLLGVMDWTAGDAKHVFSLIEKLS